jgi:type IX secretion system PorP/SprF family membrane protein
MRLLLIILLLVFFTKPGVAQDPEFTQYYSAPLYLNPAFAGTASDHRFIVNYRNQWPNIPNGFVTTAFSYDYNLPQANSAVGILATNDRAGSAGLKSTTINFQYAYKVRILPSVVVSTGLNFGAGFRSVDFNRLVFGDQLLFDAPSDDPILQSDGKSGYFDFGAGLLAYSKKFWIGFSAAHINRPNRSLSGNESEIPVRATVHGGVRLSLYHGLMKRTTTAAIMPSFVYKRQARFDQLDIGTYFLYEPVIAGIWYRGIPIQQSVADRVNQDAVVIMLGFQLAKLEIIYSYDFTVSSLGPIAGGAHEISVKYQLNVIKKTKARKKEKYIPCPTFLKD